MNTQNVNVNTAAQERSERYGKKTALKNGGLSDDQVYDLFCHVCHACGGRAIGTMESPALPADAEYLSIQLGDFDSLAVWLVDGWPVAASDEAVWIDWCIAEWLP
ncbi:ribulokinase [Serratia symbiotica]|uniref:ribulokinase n=1 Tax=Serratia symbiotica TaxID=138074 RepID=UPI001CEFD115|nr:ribulokinase [Serratia symbiotica]